MRDWTRHMHTDNTQLVVWHGSQNLCQNKNGFGVQLFNLTQIPAFLVAGSGGVKEAG